jgi:asparagine synthase (glutamine-hydrolysing)
VWDALERTLYAVRDRFGVKPLYWAKLPDGGIVLASEIKALHAAGVPAVPDPIGWSSFLARGITDQGARTFWTGIEAVPAGSLLVATAEQQRITRWYDLAARVGPDYDVRDLATVKAEYRALLEHSVRLRFRSDVPVGINLSGGLDSSMLLGLVHAVQGAQSDVKVFTFTTGDPAYDELPWVQGMLERTRHPLVDCVLRAEEVPDLAARIAHVQDEPFGGLPTLAYAKIFARARAEGVLVLLDGQGIDEQWAGYDYYRASLDAAPAPTVQGSVDPATRTDCLAPDFAARAEPLPPPSAFPDRLRNLQLRDATQTKLPRALRYNDRVSMAASTELREPFLDHRLFELAMRQPPDRKIQGYTGKWLVRELTSELLPERVRLAPKRALQTPQREWLRGPLRSWADALIERAFADHEDWFDVAAARAAWQRYQAGEGDNSYWVWQWLSLGMLRA